MKTRKSRLSTLLITALIGFYAINAPRVGAVQEQKFQTLELVRTYQSEEEYQRANAKLLRVKTPIVDNGESIKFIEPETGQLLTQLKKKEPEVLREEKQEQQTFVIKKTYDYKISPHQSLVLYTEYEGRYLKGTEASERGPQPQRRILYNRSGVVITELPPHLNYVEDSPDHNYFVAAHSGEVGADFLYFYNIQGNLLKKQAMNKKDIGFKYSTDSKYVKVDTSFLDKQVYLFTKTGDLLAQFDYRTLFRDNLFDFHISDNAQLLLFSMFSNAYLISKDGEILWQKPYLRIIDCRFNPEKIYLLFYAPIDRRNLVESRKAVYVVSLTNGELLDIIEDVELLELTPNGCWIKKEGIYYEYSVQ